MAELLGDDIPFAAVHDHVIVLQPLHAEKTKNGLVLPESAKKPYHYGYAAASGPEVKGVNQGDFVLFDPASATPVFFDNPNKTMFIVVPEPAIYLRMTTSKASELGLEMPQFDVLDVLHRSTATAVPV